MPILCNPTIAIQFFNVSTSMRVLAGPFKHAAFMSDIVRATRVGEDDDELIAECDGQHWYHNNQAYTDFEIVPWADSVPIGELGEAHRGRWS